ncbi:hypothetical protein B0T16DRAFT_429351 [Cercophora newfieldiana]|uniref:Peroxin 11C n=1 Tax=Cercophora newfieldiana TaxID=92897 RepID=A0AA40CPH6_9PEZI|nr:hypothetical protein B0T16DRAFT_429351 [Cercophora newfieldiana]
MSASAPPTAALPSGTALPPAGPSSPAKPIPVAAVVAALPSNIDVFLTRLSKALSTPTGIDTVMLFLCYTSRFSATLLSSLSASLLRRSAREWLALVASLPRGTTVLFAAPAPGGTAKPATSAAGAAALVLASRLKALSGLLSEARMILRLWALLGMYFWGKGLVAKALRKSTPEEKAKGPSKLETVVEWTRLGLCVGLQSLENGAYLSQRGVMGWSPKTQGWAYKWSSRFWAAYVGIELGRLLAEGFGGGKVFQAEETAEWRKKVVRNMAWMPLTIHWSTDAGIVNEPLIGLLASIPGIIQIRDLWAETAKAETVKA